MLYVIDTSVVIEKAISKLIDKGEIKGKILVHRAVLAELEHQANIGHEIGLLGLEELQTLQELNKKKKIELEFIGNRPSFYQIKYAKMGEIDSMIRELAYNEEATLITADRVQAESAKAFGIKVRFLELKKPKERLEIERFFDDKTMSVHIKEDCHPMGKKGKPGEWELVKVGNKKLNAKRVQEMAKEVVEKARIDPKSFTEISRRGSTVVQYKNYRVVIVKPPVADGWEITAVKPLVRLKLEDYKLPEKICNRIKGRARGVIVSGEVGSGKSTFCQSVAEFYVKSNKIVKTVESPRDLVLGEEVTQYSKNFTTSEEIHDILFLTRPDYIIFDEMRDTPDFKLYADLRLAGSNCIGVLHSASPIDAIQRFIGRLDTGMIPSVLDTVLFMEKGNIAKVYELKMLVKVPTGMTEADLARPVVEVRDFNTKKLEYEIYSYGEETVVIPVTKEAKIIPVRALAQRQIENELRSFCRDVKAEMVSDSKAVVYVPADDIAKLIGKQGKNIDMIEKSLGIKIDVQELKKEIPINFNIKERDNYLCIYTRPNEMVDVHVNGQFLFTATSSKKGEIKLHKKSKLGKALFEAMKSSKRIEVRQ
jgi:ATPase